jgi:hypothetical protein
MISISQPKLLASGVTDCAAGWEVALAIDAFRRAATRFGTRLPLSLCARLVFSLEWIGSPSKLVLPSDVAGLLSQPTTALAIASGGSKGAFPSLPSSSSFAAKAGNSD